MSRALRALSSCYVERREKLSRSGALDSAGKRAAFALFYAPLHFVAMQEIVRAVDAARDIRRVIDLGCGTGSAGAAFALEAANAVVEGIDRNRWAVEEANWTYRVLQLRGRARVQDMGSGKLTATAHDAVLASYAVNELREDARRALLPWILTAQRRGASVLIVEPIARRANRWWSEWSGVIRTAGGREDEWRFRVPLPPTQQALARAAGLDPRELTARSLHLPPGSSNIQRPSCRSV